MTFPRALLAALLALALGCAPSTVLRNGVKIPYEEAADADLREAHRALEAEDLARASEILEGFVVELRGSRRTDEALLLLADVQMKKGDPERAALIYRRLADGFRRSRLAPEARLRAATIYRDLGRPEIGRRILQQAEFGRVPAAKRAEMHRVLADLARASGDYAGAVHELAYSRRDTEDPEELGEIDLELSELIEDRLHDTELARLPDRLPRGPVHDRVLLSLARRQMRRGDYADAIASLGRLPRRLRPVDERIRRQLKELARQGHQAHVYQLGLALPLSGPYAEFGAAVLRGVILGLGVFDDPPGRFDVSVRDTQGDPARAEDVVMDLVDSGARAIVGPMRSVVAEAAAPAAQRAGVPLLTLAQRAEICDLGGFVLRLGLTPAEQVAVLADFAVNGREAQRFAVLYPRDDYGTQFKNLFWDEVERLGGEIVGVEGYDPDAVDVQKEIRKLIGLEYLTDEEHDLVAERDRLLKYRLQNEERLADPQLVDLPPYIDFDALFIPDAAASAGLILPQLRYYDVRDVMIMGPRDWNDRELVERAGRDARGVIFVDGFHDESPEPEVQAFVSRFFVAFGRRPDAFAATGYDAARLLRQTITENGPVSSLRLRDGVLGMRAFLGVSGLSAFDEGGCPRMSLHLLTFRRGRIQVVEPGAVSQDR